MPRGWYLAQGLIPLGEDSSDDDEGPCELPDGRLVCGPHGLVWCGKCCVDYSFMDEVSAENNDEDEHEDEDDNDDEEEEETHMTSLAVTSGLSSARRKGTGRVFPTEFTPPSTCTLPNDPGKALIHTDGACLANGQSNPKAGWAFWHGVNPSGTRLVASGRLEKQGPFGDAADQTSNRAELRAVIAALRFRFWRGEGFHTLVIATDSEYVVKGATAWVQKWMKNGWMTAGKVAVKNKDLWEALLGEIERHKERGMSVQFWRIPREWNTVADAAAKEAASKEEASDEWMDTMGINI
ncbi:hypothetical protein OQA88_10 [Cercophora sp. LCS_1]